MEFCQSTKVGTLYQDPSPLLYILYKAKERDPDTGYQDIYIDFYETFMNLVACWCS